MLDSKKVRNVIDENEDHPNSEQSHFVEDFRPRLEKQKSRNVS